MLVLRRERDFELSDDTKVGIDSARFPFFIGCAFDAANGCRRTGCCVQLQSSWAVYGSRGVSLTSVCVLETHSNMLISYNVSIPKLVIYYKEIA